MKVAITNQKGGAGKTVTALLTARTLANIGHTVTIIDCDPQGGSTDMLEARHKRGLFDLLTGECELDQVSYSVQESALVKIIPADFRLDQIFVTVDPFELKEICKNIKTDSIVFDCPPTMQGLSRAAIIASDRVIIPAELSRTAHGPTAYTINQVKKAKRPYAVVLSGFREPEEIRGKVTRELAEEYQEDFGPEIYVIPRTATTPVQACTMDKWSKANREKIAAPLLEAMGVQDES